MAPSALDPLVTFKEPMCGISSVLTPVGSCQKFHALLVHADHGAIMQIEHILNPYKLKGGSPIFHMHVPF